FPEHRPRQLAGDVRRKPGYGPVTDVGIRRFHRHPGADDSRRHHRDRCLPAYVDYVSPGQVNVQVPSDVPSGSQPIVVTTAGGQSLPYMITVNPVQPGVLAPLSFLTNGHQNVVAQFSNTNTYVFPGSIPGVATARAKPGDTLTMYGIGFGPVTPNIPA